ncbi:hypothetical protein R6Q57_026810 [Mikania cordata]
MYDTLKEYELKKKTTKKGKTKDAIDGIRTNNLPFDFQLPIQSGLCKELKRDNCMIIRYDDNAAVVIDQEGNPKGTRVFSAIARELRQFNFTKIVSLAPEVL